MSLLSSPAWSERISCTKKPAARRAGGLGLQLLSAQARDLHVPCLVAVELIGTNDSRSGRRRRTKPAGGNRRFPPREVGVPRFELGASPTRTERATRLRHTPRA